MLVSASTSPARMSEFATQRDAGVHPWVSRCPWGASTCVGGGDCGDDVVRRRPASGDAFGRLPRHVDAHAFDRPQRLGRRRRADRGHVAAQRFRRGTSRRGRTGRGKSRDAARRARRCRWRWTSHRTRTRSSSSSTTVATRGCGPATSPRATRSSRAGSPSSSSSSRRPGPAAATSRDCPPGRPAPRSSRMRRRSSPRRRSGRSSSSSSRVWSTSPASTPPSGATSAHWPTPGSRGTGTAASCSSSTGRSTRPSAPSGAWRPPRRGRTFLTQALADYDAVVGFDHRTLSVDPLENARDLAACSRPSVDAR